MRLPYTLIALLLTASPVFSHFDNIPTVQDLIEQYGHGYVRSNFKYSEDILDKQEHVTNKALLQLKARRDDQLCEYSFYPSFLVSGLYMHERTSISGKFPILSRLPPQHTKGKVGNEVVLNDLLVAGTGTLPWVSLYAEGQYTEIEYPGQHQMQLRKYWVTIGDLKQFPVYATIGRKTLPFGDFSSYAPFTHNHSPHYFWAQSQDPMFSVGYYDYGFNFVGTLLRNTRGRRVINTPKKNGYGNFGLVASQEICFSPEMYGKLGVGFLRGTIYNDPVAHHPPSFGSGKGIYNPVWNVNASFTYKKIDLATEFSQTVKRWPAVSHKVFAVTAQGRYRDQIYCMPTIYSIMFSKGVQGAKGTEWERMVQAVAGFEIKPHQNVRFGLEYLFNQGFVPLIRPKITGDRDVISHTINLGGEFIF